MEKLKKIIALFDELGVDYEQLTDNEITIPLVCDINNDKKTKKDSYNYTFGEWLETNKDWEHATERTVLCDDCQTFAIKMYETKYGIDIIGMIDKTVLDEYNNKED